ncbi:MAG TPA: OmpH family outer membrane protein [Saprospiraceae bacterium]|nr:OmpH family outer membrane protein [Saprospiraceae bacterium]HNT20955.1 OmpH family outer membrane protein [Saprospiraceae bacterium]
MRFLFLLFIGLSPWLAQGQKFGHINSAEILSKVPEIAQADTILRQYQDTLVAAGDSLVRIFQKHVAEYQAESQKGNLAPIAAQKKEEDLAKEQEVLRNYENEIKQRLVLRREALYKPILDKIDQVVTRIGKENKYTMIFDSSQPGYLYLAESDNLGPQVLKELGLQ